MSEVPAHPTSSHYLMATNRLWFKTCLTQPINTSLNIYFQTGMVWTANAQSIRTAGSTWSSNTTCNSHLSLQCTKPVQPVALSCSYWCNYSNDAIARESRWVWSTQEAGNKFRPQCKQCRTLRIWKGRAALKQELWTAGSENVSLRLCVWSLGFPLQLFASKRPNVKEDNINTSEGYKRLLIWKPRLTMKEEVFRKQTVEYTFKHPLNQ